MRDGTTFAARLETALPVTFLPTFSFDGTEITIEDVAQTSGTTSQNFTQTPTYRVTNEAGTTKDYQIDLSLCHAFTIRIAVVWFANGDSIVRAYIKTSSSFAGTK